jgi:hypothetical protein
MTVRAEGGSRFLYDSFDAASARIEANERVAAERWVALEYRLGLIEAALERMEKRMWVGVVGVATFLLTYGVETVVTEVLTWGR